MRASIQFLGQQYRPFEPISVIANMLGLSKSTGYRQSATWPTVGGDGCHRRVNLIALLNQLELPFSVVGEEGAEL